MIYILLLKPLQFVFCDKSALHLAANFMSIANTLKSIVMWLKERFVMVFFVCSLSTLSYMLLTYVQNLSYQVVLTSVTSVVQGGFG